MYPRKMPSSMSTAFSGRCPSSSTLIEPRLLMSVASSTTVQSSLATRSPTWSV